VRSKKVLRLVLPVAAAAAVILALLSTASDGPDGERTATAALAAKPLVDPDARPAAVPRRPHVILLIFDEWPGDSLLGRGSRIDAARFPNLAALAGNGYWFPNAFASYDSTPKATPLILDGKRPIKGNPPDPRGHRRTIYDMFGRRGYRIVNSEEATAICPRRYCRNARSRRPGILRNLNRQRVERLRRFFGRVRRGRPSFYMKHALLPHGPYLYLPSGNRTRNGARDPIPGMNSPRGYHDLFLTHHNYQRYLLQLGFVDREIGKLLRRLVRLGIFDQTMIVVTADHGFAWEVGVKDRRRVNERNVDEVATVPMFIKAPGQRRGRIVRSYMSTLDVTPTIADILNFRLPYRAYGRSAFSRTVRRRRVVRLPTRSFDRIIRISARSYERRRRANVRRRLQLFGSGPSGLFTGIGPNRDLIGRRVADLPRGGRASARAGLVGARTLRRLRRASGLLPVQVAGNVRRGRRRAKRNIAVAVNGTIQAVGRTWYLRGDRTEHFAAMIPEGSLVEGRNSVELYQVGRGKVLRLLARV
jgi:Sulfatase